MKILYVLHQFYPHYSGGTEKFALNMVQHAKKQGHEAHVLAYDAERTNIKYEMFNDAILHYSYQFEGIDVIGFF